MKKKSFYRQSELQMFLLISGGHIGAPIWRLHTKLYKGVWNVSANNPETVGHKDLRLGQIVYKLVFYDINFLVFFHGTVSNLFFYCVRVKTILLQKTFFWESTNNYIFLYFYANKLSITWESKKAYLKTAQKRVQQVKFMKYYIFLNKNKTKGHYLRNTIF